MYEMGRPLPKVKIELTGMGALGAIEVDGRNVGHLVKGLRLTADRGRLAEVDLEMMPGQAVGFDGEARVSLDPELRAVLVGLGWAPPAWDR